ncbi:conserved hypothetical protein [Flavobacterium psychrophilum]|nr:conserved hypothetical protein [Flavobacterium psychrophilum]SNB14313.1 conserved hypothetical protein [Flavobacterium psychrophilum]
MYNCGCDDCKDKATLLNLSISDDFKQLLNAGKSAFKRLHEIGNYKPQDLKTEKVYQDLIHQTYDVFNFAITDNDMPNEMRTALQSDAFLFGGLKTHAQLFEASKLLLDDNGNLKPFDKLSNEFDKLNLTYNKNYLEAEYEFAVSSSQMAAGWSELGSSERYFLQYRTSNDNRVRDEHAALNNTTLPKEDPFWDSYYPPNGWRCRCIAIEVLKDKYPISDSEKSIKAGEAATTQIGKDGKNRLEIFRFNPGADKKLFPPKHPLFANRCTGDGKLSVTGLIGAPVLILSAEKSKCEASKIIEEIQKENTSKAIKQSRIDIKEWAKDNLIGKTVKHPNIEKPILFTSTGIKEALNQPHKFILEKNKAVKNIESLIKDSEFVKSDKDSKGRSVEYHYLKTQINKEDSYIIIKYQENRNSFYSIVEKLK